MPCDTVSVTNVDLAKVARNHPETLRLALEAIGATQITITPKTRTSLYTVWFRIGGYDCSLTEGQLTSDGNSDAITARLKTAYSMEVVKRAARQYGWTAKAKGSNKLIVSKR